MQNLAIVVWLYGALVLIGGVMGWLKAKSKPSLYSGVGFGIALIVSGFLIHQNQQKAVLATEVLAALLLVVMGLRFGKTKKFMPAGLVAVLSLIVLVVLILAPKN